MLRLCAFLLPIKREGCLGEDFTCFYLLWDFLYHFLTLSFFIFSIAVSSSDSKPRALSPGTQGREEEGDMSFFSTHSCFAPSLQV